jgi:hypothetical protein
VQNKEMKISVDEFEGLVKKIKTKMKGGSLRHNESNVKLILRAVAASPTTAEYPHPALQQLFHKQMDKLEADRECVATWAAPEALGLKTKEGALVGKKEILGIYGGTKTKSKGIYVLDVTVAGSEQLLVDGDPELDSSNIFGRINEDILYNKKNINLDVGGIVYSTSRINGREELLTTYGGEYKWGHVMQVGLDRLRRDVDTLFPSLSMDIPRELESLRESNLMEGWLKGLVCGNLPERSIHSTWDPEIEEDSVEGFVSYITSNVAYNRYSFRRCGRDDLRAEDIDRVKVGRKLVEYLTRHKEDKVRVPFFDLIKGNWRIGSLYRTVKPEVVVNLPPIIVPLPPRDGVLHNQVVDTAPSCESSRICAFTEELRTRFPWLEPHLAEGVERNESGNVLWAAIMDILEGRLTPQDLHSGRTGSDWALSDDLAAYLKSGVTYGKYNLDLCASDSSDREWGRKKSEIPLTRWCPDKVIKAHH